MSNYFVQAAKKKVARNKNMSAVGPAVCLQFLICQKVCIESQKFIHHFQLRHNILADLHFPGKRNNVL